MVRGVLEEVVEDPITGFSVPLNRRGAMSMTPEEQSESRRLNRVLSLIGNADDHSRGEALARLGLAVKHVMDRFPQLDCSYDEFKVALSPLQAEQVAMRTFAISEHLASQTPKGNVKPRIDGMVFYLIANSLYAKAGARWIGPDEEDVIDSWIRIAVILVG